MAGLSLTAAGFAKVFIREPQQLPATLRLLWSEIIIATEVDDFDESGWEFHSKHDDPWEHERLFKILDRITDGLSAAALHSPDSETVRDLYQHRLARFLVVLKELSVEGCSRHHDSFTDLIELIEISLGDSVGTASAEAGQSKPPDLESGMTETRSPGKWVRIFCDEDGYSRTTEWFRQQRLEKRIPSVRLSQVRVSVSVDSLPDWASTRSQRDTLASLNDAAERKKFIESQLSRN